MKFASLTIEDEEHDANSDQVHYESDEHERTLVACEKTRRRTQSEDREDFGDMMYTAGDHRSCGRPAACTHHVTCSMHGCDRNEETETQNRIERSLHTKAQDDWNNIPTVTDELRGGIVPTLQPGEDAEIE